jgi:outer membrane protein assembly factor BamB
MSKQDDLFRPDRVDEQIETLSHEQGGDMPSPSSARLVSNLRQVCEEDTGIVEQVWVRLGERAAEKRRATAAGQNVVQSRSLATIRADQRKGPQPVKPVLTDTQTQSKRLRFLELLIAVLIMTTLVGSMGLIFKIRQPSTVQVGSSTRTTIGKTQTPSPASSDQTGLYITTSQGIDRVSLQSGKTIWHIGIAYAEQPLVMEGMLFFSHEDSQNYYLEAVNALTGKQLWRKNYGSSTFLQQGTHNTLYDSSCVTINTTTGARHCFIYAIKASTGEQLWSYPTPLGTSWIAVQDGVVYSVSYTQFFALSASTGTPIWQKTLPYPDQQANMMPLLSSNVLYFSSCNTTKQSAAFGGCYFYAFNASNGGELWHRPVSNTVLTDPTISDGVVYYGSSNPGSNTGAIYALDAQTGALLWMYNTDGAFNPSVRPLIATRGAVYAQIDLAGGTSMSLLALRVADRSVLWSKTLAVYYEGTPALVNGLIYVTVGQHTVEAFHANDGTQAAGYTDAAAAITGFTLVTQNAQ